MIVKVFATVGSTYPLDRLIRQLDELGKDKKYLIFAQIGESKFTPKNIKFKNFLNYKEMQAKINWADVIVSHAGAGSIIDLLTSKKSFVLFPRLKEYGEAIDDHQIEICKAFEKKYKVNYTKKAGKVGELVLEAKPIKLNKDSSLKKEIVKLI